MRKGIRNTMIVGALGAAAFTGGTAFAEGGSNKASSQDNPLVQRGCVIRFDTQSRTGTTVPRIHSNSKHYCVGVTAEPTVDDQGRLVVRTDGADQPVVSIAVSPDETLTAKGITCGGSGGSGRTVIACYDRNGKPVRADSPTIHGKYANLWLTWTTWEK